MVLKRPFKTGLALIASLAALAGCERVPEWERVALKSKAPELQSRLSEMSKWIYSCRGLISQSEDSRRSETWRAAQGLESVLDYFRSKNLSALDTSDMKSFLGTAFLWNKQGYLVLALPKAEIVKEIECRSQSSDWTKVKVLGVDESIDYALLKLETVREKLGDNPWLSRAEDLARDENFFVISSALTGHLDFAPVTLQALAPMFQSGFDVSLMTFLPVLSPVQAGGVLVDERLRVVGFTLPHFEGFGLVLNREKMKAFVTAAQSGEAIKRPYVGFRMRLNPEQGFIIQQVAVNSPAYQAGLRPQDHLVEWDGRSLSRLSDWREVTPSDVGRSIRIKYQRGRDLTESSLRVSSQE